MKQYNLFGQKVNKEKEKKYTSKIEAPIYEPKNIKPNIGGLCDKEKVFKLLREIKQANLPKQEKKFLIDAAKRHIVFNYELIADYYSHASKEMQDLMEKSGLVIIDFNKAIEYGYVKLSDAIRKQYLEEYGKKDK